MQNVAVFSYEAEEFGREGQRKYLVTTYYEFGQKYLSTKAPRHFYEVITEVFRSNSHAGKFCWPKSIPISTCNLSTIPLAHPNIDFITLATTGSFVFSICDDLRHLKECRDYGSRLLEQAYRHLFVDTPLKCKHPLCCGPPCEQLLSLFLKNDAGKDILICDESVYTRNRNFRLFLSSKLGKKVPLIVAKENKFKSAYGVDHEKRKRSQTFNTLLDSLICNARFETHPTVLDYYHARVPPTSSSSSHHPYEEGRDVLLSHTQDGKDHSPYPGVDLFIGGEIGKDGGRPGSIRRWTFFPQGKLIVYDIKDNRWCGNIGREHKSNNIMIVVDLSLGVFYQKCYDPDCRKANYRSKDHILPAEVNPVHCQMESGSRDENPGRHDNRGDDYTYLGDLSDTDGDEALPPGVCWNTCTPKAVPIEPQLCQEGQGNPPQNQRDSKGEGSPPCGQGGQKTPMGQVYQEQELDQEQSWNKLLGDHGIPINDVLNISAEEMKSFLDEADEPSPLGDQFSVSSDEIDSFFDMNPDVYQSVGAQGLLAMQEQTDVDKVVPLVETGVGTTGATPVGVVVDDVWAILLGDREHVEPDKDKSHHGEEDSKSGCDCKSDDMEQMTSSQWDSFVNQ
ncbi:hypothetical protein EMCRGX_G032530 [Ephydatia muelleri]